LDVRHEHDFAKGHIPKSIFIGLDGDFAPWVGALIADVEQPILLVTPKGREEEAVTRLSRVGFDNTLGYLKGSFEAWKEAQKEYDDLSTVSPQQFAEKMKANIKIIDVRKPSEYQAERIENAENIPLDFLNERLAELPKDDTFYVHCAGGYRSVIASSILKARGMHNMINVEEGFDVLKTIDKIPKTSYVCPTTLK
ncbi:MAG: rhodanese-like domain-containing protein, partial [Vicingaceae bacterium]